jgi:pimeloyl-ACP methyl ester carboxylesterase
MDGGVLPIEASRPPVDAAFDRRTPPPPAVDSGVDAPIVVRESGAGDGGALVPAVSCDANAAAVYAAVPGLPPMTQATRGDITVCTSDGTSDTATVQSDLTAEGDVGVTATTGVSIYRVQYRTTRANGSAAVSSARIYLPLVPLEATPTVIVAAHGTEGLAASCTTSMNATSMRELALPWASIGYPVIAPDYAGLGTPGVQGYTDNRDTARSIIDSVSALRKFVSMPLSQKVIIDGHSQGGGGALATQALATQMGLDGTLVAVLAFAPEYYSHLDSLGFLGALESVPVSNPLTLSTGVTKPAVATMMEYQYFANYQSSALPTAGFPAAQASSLGSSIESLCTIPLGGAVQAEAVHVADWTDPTFRDELLSCIHGPGDAGLGSDAAATTCTGVGQDFYGYLKQNILTPDATGAPVLLVQGLEDIVMPPDQEAACNVIALEAGGLTPQVCTDSAALHTNVVQRNIAFGIQWAQAVLAGTTPPACAASDLPACDQP